MFGRSTPCKKGEEKGKEKELNKKAKEEEEAYTDHDLSKQDLLRTMEREKKWATPLHAS